METGSNAILMHYSSDATGRKTKFHFTGQKKDQGPLARVGTELSEFLVERVFFKSTSVLGEDLGVAMVMPARCLDHGKGAWQCMSALLDVPTLKELGHVGISVSHYAFDRGIYPSLCPKVHRRHAMRWEKLESEQLAEYDPRAELCDLGGDDSMRPSRYTQGAGVGCENRN